MTAKVGAGGVGGAIRSFSKIVSIGLAVLLATSLVAIQMLRVGGPVYEEIARGKDLVADILPPPEYIIEAYLETTLALNAPQEASTHAARLRQLERDYNDRQAYWTRSALAQDLKQKLLVGAHDPAAAFWSEIDTTFMPALEKGDSVAAQASYQRLSQAYAEHRAAIDDLVAAANARNARTETLANLALVVVAVLVVIVAGVLLEVVRRRAARIAREVVRPLDDMTRSMTALSAGDLDQPIPHADRADEMGQMAKALAVFRDQARLTGQLRDQQEAARLDRETERAGAELERAEALRGMAERVERETRAAVESVARSMRVMASKSQDMSEAATTIESSSADAADAATDAQRSTMSVASAADELDAAILGINDQVAKARGVAAAAVGAADEAQATIERLSVSIGEIDKITHLIADIARQSNLLAINASVEAARAGEAGKGFSVVAGEVRSLSQQTASATAEIGQLIAGVQDAAGTAVEAVKAIGGHVSGVDDASLTIVAAVREQTAATRAIAHDVAQASVATQSAAARIGQVSNEAARARAHAQEVSQLSAEVSRDMDNLRSTLVRVVRTSTDDVERRQHPRFSTRLRATLSHRNGSSSVEVSNLSEGGALLIGVPEGAPSRLALVLSGVPQPVACDLLGQEGDMGHVRFRLEGEQAAQIAALTTAVAGRSSEQAAA